MRFRHYWDDKYVRSIGLLVVIGALLTLSVWYVDKNARDDLRAEQAKREKVTRTLVARSARENVNSCRRGNDTRAYLIIEAGTSDAYPPAVQQAARDLFAIVNCEATLRTGHPVLLGDAEANLYISRVAQKMGIAAWNANRP